MGALLLIPAAAAGAGLLTALIGRSRRIQLPVPDQAIANRDRYANWHTDHHEP